MKTILLLILLAGCASTNTGNIESIRIVDVNDTVIYAVRLYDNYDSVQFTVPDPETMNLEC